MLDAPSSDTDRVLGLEDDDTGQVLDALAPASARAILAELECGSATAPELADRTALTTQNVAYHLGKLTEAELVRTDGTRGTGGNAPTVYAPTGGVTVSARRDPERSRRPVGLLAFGVGLLLTVLCLHSVTDQPVTLLTLLEHELGHLLALV